MLFTLSIQFILALKNIVGLENVCVGNDGEKIHFHNKYLLFFTNCLDHHTVVLHNFEKSGSGVKG